MVPYALYLHGISPYLNNTGVDLNSKDPHGKTITLLFFQDLTKQRNIALKTSIHFLKRQNYLLTLFIPQLSLKKLSKQPEQTLLC